MRGDISALRLLREDGGGGRGGGEARSELFEVCPVRSALRAIAAITASRIDCHSGCHRLLHCYPFRPYLSHFIPSSGVFRQLQLLEAMATWLPLLGWHFFPE